MSTVSKELNKENLDKLLKNEFVYTVEETITDTEETNNEEINETTNEEVKEEPVKKQKVSYNKITFPSRGFNSLDEAIAFMETSYFKGLGKADKDEYTKWLIK